MHQYKPFRIAIIVLRCIFGIIESVLSYLALSALIPELQSTALMLLTILVFVFIELAKDYIANCLYHEYNQANKPIGWITILFSILISFFALSGKFGIMGVEHYQATRHDSHTTATMTQNDSAQYQATQRQIHDLNAQRNAITTAFSYKGKIDSRSASAKNIAAIDSNIVALKSTLFQIEATSIANKKAKTQQQTTQRSYFSLLTLLISAILIGFRLYFKYRDEQICDKKDTTNNPPSIDINQLALALADQITTIKHSDNPKKQLRHTATHYDTSATPQNDTTTDTHDPTTEQEKSEPSDHECLQTIHKLKTQSEPKTWDEIEQLFPRYGIRSWQRKYKEYKQQLEQSQPNNP